MIDIKDIGPCEIVGQDEFTITIAVEGSSHDVRCLDREDYPELSAECAYEKTLMDTVKDYALDINKDEFVYVNIFDAFDSRRVSPVEVRTKLEDYLITFETLNGHAIIDDLEKTGNCTLISRRKYDYAYNFADVVAGIEYYYRSVE